MLTNDYFCDKINEEYCVHLCKPQKGGLSEVMLLNDLEKDIKIKCIENDTTQIGLAEKIGKTGQYVNRIVKKNGGVLNKTFIQMMEGLGYDIQLTYVKREEKNNE